MDWKYDFRNRTADFSFCRSSNLTPCGSNRLPSVNLGLLGKIAPSNRIPYLSNRLPLNVIVFTNFQKFITFAS